MLLLKARKDAFLHSECIGSESSDGLSRLQLKLDEKNMVIENMKIEILVNCFFWCTQFPRKPDPESRRQWKLIAGDDFHYVGIFQDFIASLVFAFEASEKTNKILCPRERQNNVSLVYTLNSLFRIAKPMHRLAQHIHVSTILTCEYFKERVSQRNRTWPSSISIAWERDK